MDAVLEGFKLMLGLDKETDLSLEEVRALVIAVKTTSNNISYYLSIGGYLTVHKQYHDWGSYTDDSLVNINEDDWVTRVQIINKLRRLRVKEL